MGTFSVRDELRRIEKKEELYRKEIKLITKPKSVRYSITDWRPFLVFGSYTPITSGETCDDFYRNPILVSCPDSSDYTQYNFDERGCLVEVNIIKNGKVTKTTHVEYEAETLYGYSYYVLEGVFYLEGVTKCIYKNKRMISFFEQHGIVVNYALFDYLDGCLHRIYTFVYSNEAYDKRLLLCPFDRYGYTQRDRKKHDVSVDERNFLLPYLLQPLGECKQEYTRFGYQSFPAPKELEKNEAFSPSLYIEGQQLWNKALLQMSCIDDTHDYSTIMYSRNETNMVPFGFYTPTALPVLVSGISRGFVSSSPPQTDGVIKFYFDFYQRLSAVEWFPYPNGRNANTLIEYSGNTMYSYTYSRGDDQSRHLELATKCEYCNGMIINALYCTSFSEVLFETFEYSNGLLKKTERVYSMPGLTIPVYSHVFNSRQKSLVDKVMPFLSITLGKANIVKPQVKKYRRSFSQEELKEWLESHSRENMTPSEIVGLFSEMLKKQESNDEILRFETNAHSFKLGRQIQNEKGEYNTLWLTAFFDTTKQVTIEDDEMEFEGYELDKTSYRRDFFSYIRHSQAYQQLMGKRSIRCEVLIFET